MQLKPILIKHGTEEISQKVAEADGREEADGQSTHLPRLYNEEDDGRDRQQERSRIDERERDRERDREYDYRDRKREHRDRDRDRSRD